jgi:hypothetical protein
MSGDRPTGMAAADQLLVRWGFVRSIIDDGETTTRYVALAGVFAIRVLFTPAGTATLELGLREPGRALYHPWSVPLPQEPWPLAVEAVGFLRVLID